MRKFKAWLVTGPLARVVAFAIDFTVGVRYLVAARRSRRKAR